MMAGFSRWRTVAYVMIAAGFVLAPFAIYPMFLMKVLTTALFVVAFNLLFGFGGLLSFGHTAFYGTSAYFTGFFLKLFGFEPLLSLVGGVLVGTALGSVFGLLAIRRSGIYFAMVTFALAELVYFTALRADVFTGGEDGLTAVPRGELLGIIDLSNQLTMYYFVLLVCAGAFLFSVRIVRSPFGQILKAIRQHEDRAISLGIRVARARWILFVLSAFLASVAGGLKVMAFQVASLSDVHWITAGHVVLMALVGGVGTLTGPIVGAFLVNGMEEYLAFLGEWVTPLIGVVFVLCVMIFRRGIMGEMPAMTAALRRRLLDRRAAKRPALVPEPESAAAASREGG